MKPEVFVFDMDGTLADITGLDPYKRPCDEDPEYPVVLAVARALQSAGYPLVIVSGRKENYRQKTHAWLVWRGLEYLALYMRDDHDQRPDHVVKEDILVNCLLPRYDIVGVFDDRPSVVAMWRRNGLTCFQVAEREEPVRRQKE